MFGPMPILPKTLDSKPNLSTLMVEKTKTLFATHHIELSAATVTPDQACRAINNWLVKTFAREWGLVASAVSTHDIPHGPKDPFANDPFPSMPMDNESEKSICSDSMRHSPSVETVSSVDDDEDHHHQHNVVPSIAPGNIRHLPGTKTGLGSPHDASRTTTASRKQP
jgi:hypothetical protein